MDIYSVLSIYVSDEGCWKTHIAFFKNEEDALMMTLRIEDWEKRFENENNPLEKKQIQNEFDNFMQSVYDIDYQLYLGTTEFTVAKHKVR